MCRTLQFVRSLHFIFIYLHVIIFLCGHLLPYVVNTIECSHRYFTDLPNSFVMTNDCASKFFPASVNCDRSSVADANAATKYDDAMIPCTTCTENKMNRDHFL